MNTVAPLSPSVHDILAVPLRDQPVGGGGVTVLVLLVAVAIVLFQALRAVVTALLGLLLPALALLRWFVVVVGLIAAVGYGLVAGPAQPPPDTTPGPSPTVRTGTSPIPPIGPLTPPTPGR